MASVSFNLQLYAEAVHHAEQANTIRAGCADDMLELYRNMASRRLSEGFLHLQQFPNHRLDRLAHQQESEISRMKAVDRAFFRIVFA